MIRVSFPELDLTVEAEPGIDVLDLARRHSLPLPSYCGGRGTCGKCRVRVEGPASPPTAAELALISPHLLDKGERLACQVRLWGETRVTIVEAGWGEVEKPAGEVKEVFYPLDPGLVRRRLDRPASLRSSSSSTWDVLRQALLQTGIEDVRPDLGALRELKDCLWGWEEWEVILVGSRLLRVGPATGDDRLHGMAFDLGTTTVAGYLLDLTLGKQVALASTLNPQADFGADVISRISFAAQDPSGLSQLQARIVEAINSLIQEITSRSRIPAHTVYALSIVGNTVMHHLLLGLDPSGLGHLPYQPVATDPLQVRADELGLQVHPRAAVFLLPNISGYAGSDLVAAILSSGMARRQGITLGIDIGTNGEMALGSRHRILVASAAAGPAFEGSQISCGMRAEPGAISQVWIEGGDLRWKTVGEIRPRGLCGSGLVDLLAILLQWGIIDSGGRFQDPDRWDCTAPSCLRHRLVPADDGGWEFILCPEGVARRPLALTQRDIRELQLAKAAIRAGIEILLDEFPASLSEVEEIWLAGAFGNYIDPGSAQAIGLLPPYPRSRIRPVGNAAGEGAKIALLSRTAREEACRLARERISYIDLASRTDFQDRFVDALRFPNPPSAS